MAALLRRHLLVRASWLSSGLACALTFASSAEARLAGIIKSSCTGCHGDSPAELEVTVTPASVNPGEPVTIRVLVSGSLKAAGISANFPEGGSFVLPAGDVLAVSDTYVLHTQPKPATDGQVEFLFDWVTPAQPGAGSYNIAVLAANGDGRPGGDATATEHGRIAFGCELVTLYRDLDGDGTGITDQFVSDCDGLPGFAAQGGDCDDEDAQVYPGAAELCNEVDDDCDGEVDEDVVDLTYYSDEDADGFGYAEESVQACAPLAGYVGNALDCNWRSATTYPAAEEVCDLVDNNCDGAIDEGFDTYCGLGECRRRSQLCLVECVPGEPALEQCNGLDDDCDGVIDDGCGDEPAVAAPPVVVEDTDATAEDAEPVPEASGAASSLNPEPTATENEGATDGASESPPAISNSVGNDTDDTAGSVSSVSAETTSDSVASDEPVGDTARDEAAQAADGCGLVAFARRSPGSSQSALFLALTLFAARRRGKPR